jgi:hypothetical protein
MRNSRLPSCHCAAAYQPNRESRKSEIDKQNPAPLLDAGRNQAALPQNCLIANRMAARTPAVNVPSVIRR